MCLLPLLSKFFFPEFSNFGNFANVQDVYGDVLQRFVIFFCWKNISKGEFHLFGVFFFSGKSGR